MKWEELVNAESESSEWDFFNRNNRIELVRFNVTINDVEKLVMTKESWLDLVKLIRSITED